MYEMCITYSCFSASVPTGGLVFVSLSAFRSAKNDDRALSLVCVAAGCSAEIRRNMSSLLTLKLFKMPAVYESFMFNTVLITWSLPKRSAESDDDDDDDVEEDCHKKQHHENNKHNHNTEEKYGVGKKQQNWNRHWCVRLFGSTTDSFFSIFFCFYADGCSWRYSEGENGDLLTFHSAKHLLCGFRRSILAGIQILRQHHVTTQRQYQN